MTRSKQHFFVSENKRQKNGCNHSYDVTAAAKGHDISTAVLHDSIQIGVKQNMNFPQMCAMEMWEWVHGLSSRYSIELIRVGCFFLWKYVSILVL